jgi:hypothetical protein
MLHPTALKAPVHRGFFYTTFADHSKFHIKHPIWEEETKKLKKEKYSKGLLGSRDPRALKRKPRRRRANKENIEYRTRNIEDRNEV